MDANVLRLTQLVTPPQERASTSPPWADAEGIVGFQFPLDYRDFVDAYGGSGWFDRDLYIISPTLRQTDPDFDIGFRGFLDNTTIGLGRDVADERENAIALGNEESFPYPIYPEEGGLILFAYNSNGDMCFWDPKLWDNPEGWTVVIFQQAARRWVTFDGGFARLLLAAASGTYPDVPWLMGFAEGGHQWIREFTWAG